MSARVYASYADAVAAEVLPRFAPFGYTPADVERVAMLMLTARDDGTFACDLDTQAEFWELFKSTVKDESDPPEECLLPWCAGISEAHDGTGRYRDHRSTEDTCGPRNMIYGAIEQQGANPPFYRFNVSEPPRRVLLTVSEVRALADEFERFAVTLRERAAQLEQLRGMA